MCTEIRDLCICKNICNKLLQSLLPQTLYFPFSWPLYYLFSQIKGPFHKACMLKSFQITNNGGQTLKIAPHTTRKVLSRFKFPKAQALLSNTDQLLFRAPLQGQHSMCKYQCTETSPFTQCSNTLLLLFCIILLASK